MGAGAPEAQCVVRGAWCVGNGESVWCVMRWERGAGRKLDGAQFSEYCSHVVQFSWWGACAAKIVSISSLSSSSLYTGFLPDNFSLS